MISWLAQSASLSVDSGTGNAGLPGAAAYADRLALGDAVIWWTGLVLAVIGISVWLLRSRRDPLTHAPDRRNRVLPEHVLLLVVAYTAAAVAVSSAAEHLLGSDALKLSAGNLVQLAGGVACLVLGAKLFDGGLRGFVAGRGGVGRRVVEGVLLTFVALTVCGMVYDATVLGIGLIDAGYEPPEHSVIQALRSNSEPAWALRIGAALIAPVAEECFFRGMIQTVLRNVLKRPWPAVVIASLLFGMAHSQQPQVVPTLVVLGVLLGVGYERSGSLVAPVTLHVLFNLKTLTWAALGGAG